MMQIINRFIVRGAMVLVLGMLSMPLLADIPRTPSGKPDLTGVYDTGTLTPTQRPEWLGETEYVFPFVARFLNWAFGLALEWANDESDPDRGAPEAGGDGNNVAGAGGVGGYNAFWVDPGSELVVIDGRVPTSILTTPADGRYPPMRADARARREQYYQSFGHENTGTASWLEDEGPGPFDGPESLAPSERCLISFASTVPNLPSLYNNYKRIVQTGTHIMILNEMVHDARVIRIDGQHQPVPGRQWLGDSVGHWEGDALVVTTRHFRRVNGLPGADENLVVEERFSRREDGDLAYEFMVRDDTVWDTPWGGRYLWQSKSDSKVYEYACHEGNYAMGNILRGARLLEKEWREGQE